MSRRLCRVLFSTAAQYAPKARVPAVPIAERPKASVEELHVEEIPDFTDKKPETKPEEKPAYVVQHEFRDDESRRHEPVH